MLATLGKGFKMVRYADEWVVLCRSVNDAKAALSLIQSWIDSNGLELSPEKTHIGSSLQPGHGFEFSGYRFEDGCRYVRSKSLKQFKDKICLKTRRTRGDNIEQIIPSGPLPACHVPNLLKSHHDGRYLLVISEV